MKKITFKGQPLTLVGRNLKPKSLAPNFSVTALDMSEVTLDQFKNKIKIITSFPSLDTPVCDLQVKEFNKRASKISKQALILAISKDLPFAQKRFCESFSIQNLHLLSDYKNSSFAVNYGLLIKEWNLLARAVLILDQNDCLRYEQVVDEVTHAPNYEEVLQQLEGVIKNPKSPLAEMPTRCLPCEGKVAPLSKEKIEKLLLGVTGWEWVEEKKLVKEFSFKDFIEAKYFLDLLAQIAQSQGHHPTFTLMYNKLKVSLATHAAKGLTENDFIMARIIDQVQ